MTTATVKPAAHTKAPPPLHHLIGMRNHPLYSEKTQMIIDHARGLHVGIHHRGADEAKAAMLELF